MIRFISDRKAKYKNLGISCAIDLWDFKTNLPKKKHPNYLEIKELIQSKTTELEKILCNLKIDNQEESIDSIIKIFSTNQKSTSVLNYFDEVIIELKANNKIGNSIVYLNAKNSLKSFLKDKDIALNQISISFLLKYQDYLLSRGNALSTTHNYLRTFKTLFLKARTNGLVKKEFNPFEELSFKRYRGIKTKKRALTSENIKDIINLDIDKSSRLYDSKLYFLFSFLNVGMNFTDMAILKWNQINKNKISYQRQKTGQQFEFTLLEEVKEILKYFKPFTFKNSNDYVFPVLDKSHDNPTSIHNRIKKVLKQYNNDLKTIGEMVELEIPLTSYVARHSAATIMKRSGVSTSIISQSLGHTTEKTTQIYLDSFDDTTMNQALSTLTNLFK